MWVFSNCAMFTRAYFFLQHASSDVERMILGNKCDMNEKRQVSKEKGEKVKFGCGFGGGWR